MIKDGKYFLHFLDSLGFKGIPQRDEEDIPVSAVTEKVSLVGPIRHRLRGHPIAQVSWSLMNVCVKKIITSLCLRRPLLFMEGG